MKGLRMLTKENAVTKETTMVWKGASGKSYKYWIYELPHDFKDGIIGNYIFAKVVDDYWQPVYIGQGNLGGRVSPGHHQADCIKKKGATHIQAHTRNEGNTEEARKAEEADLLASYPQAYAPTGCNVKEEG